MDDRSLIIKMLFLAEYARALKSGYWSAKPGEPATPLKTPRLFPTNLLIRHLAVSYAEAFIGDHPRNAYGRAIAVDLIANVFGVRRTRNDTTELISVESSWSACDVVAEACNSTYSAIKMNYYRKSETPTRKSCAI